MTHVENGSQSLRDKGLVVVAHVVGAISDIREELVEEGDFEVFIQGDQLEGGSSASGQAMREERCQLSSKLLLGKTYLVGRAPLGKDPPALLWISAICDAVTFGKPSDSGKGL